MIGIHTVEIDNEASNVSILVVNDTTIYKEFFEYVNTFIKKNYYDIKTNTFYLI